MTLDTLVAFIALLFTAYQITPKARQLDLRLRFLASDRFIAIISFCTILYLQFYAVFKKLGLTPNFGLWRWNLTPEKASFVILLITVTIIVTHIRFTKLTPRKITKFRQLAEELINQKNYTELFTLLEKHIDPLVRIAKDDFYLSHVRRHHLDTHYRLANWYALLESELESKPELEFGLETESKEEIRPKIELLKHRMEQKFSSLARFLPDKSKEREVANDLLHSIFTSKELVENLVKSRPYIALNFFKYDLLDKDVFLDIYWRALLLDPSSVLYYELKNQYNQDIWGDISETNRLLHFFFGDARFAEKLQVWRPIGETLIAQLDEQIRKPEEDLFNLSLDREFEINGQWESPLFPSLYLFDLMVFQALKQNIEWHMWLYYFTYFSKAIVRNNNPSSQYRSFEGIYRTRYDKALDTIFYILRNWVKAIERVPRDQSNVTLRRTLPDHENGNIPKSSLVALGQCLDDVLFSENMHERFKHSVLHGVFSLYFDLMSMKADGYAEVLIQILQSWKSKTNEKARIFRAMITDAYETFDRIPHQWEYVEQFEEKLSLNKELTHNRS